MEQIRFQVGKIILLSCLEDLGKFIHPRFLQFHYQTHCSLQSDLVIQETPTTDSESHWSGDFEF